MGKKVNEAPTPASGGNGGPLGVLGQIVGKLNKQILLFAIAVVIVVAVLGQRIPTEFSTLIYVVVLLAMAAYVFLEVLAVVGKGRGTKPAATTTQKSAPDKQGEAASSPGAPGGQQAMADRGGAAATGGSQAAAGGSAVGGTDSVNVSGKVGGGIRVSKTPPERKGQQ